MTLMAPLRPEARKPQHRPTPNTHDEDQPSAYRPGLGNLAHEKKHLSAHAYRTSASTSLIYEADRARSCHDVRQAAAPAGRGVPFAAVTRSSGRPADSAHSPTCRAS